MSLQNIKDQKGFTIVELLIVIVVIGILAAITIVAFNGIQNRSKSSASQSLANSVVKKAEAWNSVQGSYPTYCQLVNNRTDSTLTSGTCSAGTAANAGPAEAKLDDSSAVVQGPIAVGTTNNGKAVGYAQSGSTATVTWWKFDGTAGAQTITLGS